MRVFALHRRPDDAMDWVFGYFSDESNDAAAVIETTGAIIMGRQTYEVEDRYRPGIYGAERVAAQALRDDANDAHAY